MHGVGTEGLVLPPWPADPSWVGSFVFAAWAHYLFSSDGILILQESEFNCEFRLWMPEV